MGCFLINSFQLPWFCIFDWFNPSSPRAKRGFIFQQRGESLARNSSPSQSLLMHFASRSH